MIKHTCGHKSSDIPFTGPVLSVSGSIGVDNLGRIARVGPVTLELSVAARLAKLESLPLTLTCPGCHQTGTYGKEFTLVTVCAVTGDEPAELRELSPNISAPISQRLAADILEFIDQAPSLTGV